MMTEYSPHGGNRRSARAVPLRKGLLIVGLSCSIVSCDSGGEARDSDSNAQLAMLEAKEAASEPVPICADSPRNGATLTRDSSKGKGAHEVSVLNGSQGNAIVNIRDSETSDLLLSFFVEERKEAAIGDVPSGNYRIQYAFGDELDEDCSSFAIVQSASQDPQIVVFPAQSAMQLRYELLPREGGNFEGEAIDPSEFSAD